MYVGYLHCLTIPTFTSLLCCVDSGDEYPSDQIHVGDISRGDSVASASDGEESELASSADEEEMVDSDLDRPTTDEEDTVVSAPHHHPLPSSVPRLASTGLVFLGFSSSTPARRTVHAVV
jgi:hypothetical protein